MNAKNGTDQLTKTLNSYMGSIVECIINSDGDVMKYAGDYTYIFKTKSSISLNRKRKMKQYVSDEFCKEYLEIL